MAVEIPHVDLPFRFTNKGVAVAEQDSQEDVTNCVEAICRYPIGLREDLPEFGVPDQLFAQEPLDIDPIFQAIETWEPRAEASVNGEQDGIDIALSRIIVKVTGGEIVG